MTFFKGNDEPVAQAAFLALIYSQVETVLVYHSIKKEMQYAIVTEIATVGILH